MVIIIHYSVAARVRLARSLRIGFQDANRIATQRDRKKLAGSTNSANLEWSSPAGGHDHREVARSAAVPVALFIKTGRRSGRDQIGAFDARAGGDIDTTVQPKAIAHPTDVRLCHREHIAMCGCETYGAWAKRAAIMGDAIPTPTSSGGAARTQIPAYPGWGG